MRGFVVAALLLFLAGCSGDGGNGAARLLELEAGIRLGGILERADTLLVPGVHVRYSVSTITDIWFQEVSCSEITCAGGREDEDADAVVNLGLTDLVSLDVHVSDVDVDLQSRDGFDTASIQGNLNASNIEALVPDITITGIPQGLGYGFWGSHGVAGVFLADGPFSGESNNIPFGGDMIAVVPFVIGDVSGTSPEGIGEATWTGVAEIVSIRTFRRQEGTATLTIPDLSLPTVSVGINDVDGNPIGKADWMDLPLAEGGFSFGTAGDDYLEGNFHGVDHSETYGVFDTDAFTGAFGAKRQGENGKANAAPVLDNPT